jgi:hypothetical protein
MGEFLADFRDHQRFLRLGFVRMGDYVLERLGISLRTAQELIRVREILQDLPLVRAAFVAGRITTGHVRLIARVATPDDEVSWIARARRMDVRRLGRMVATALKRYAGKHFGLSPRRMYDVMALGRTLERLPDLRRAFVSGRLTLRQALLLGRVAERATTSEWVRRAGGVTLRRLDDEVTYWELLRAERPEVWDLLRGGPPPEAIVLVPGKAPRLHQSAQRPEAAHRASQGLDAGDREGDRGDPANGMGADGTRFDRATSSGVADLHAPAWDLPPDAGAFLRALEAAEAETPLPWRRATLRLRVDPETRRQYHATIACLRSMSDEPIEE